MPPRPAINRPRTALDMGIMQGFPPPPEKRPTLENWDLAPFNRWSFQNMRSLFPTADVPRGTAPVAPLDRAEVALGALEFTGWSGRKLRLSDWLEESYTDGFIVLHQGRVVAERYENGLSPQTPHLAQSVSKSVVGALAGVLHGEGAFDLAQPLDDIVPELAGTGYAGCTMDHALDMLSGVRFTEDYGVPWSDMTRIDIASGWRPERHGAIRPTIRDVILTLPREREHGAQFAYRSIETDVVAWALERAAGMPLAALVSDRIWRHLGCERDGFFTVDGAGTALADGGFNATLRDFARFGRMIADQGRVGDRQIVPQDWIAGIARQRHRDSFAAPYTDLSPKGDYRRFFWVHDGERQQYMARGVFGQLIFVDQTAGVVIVKLSSWPDYLVPDFSGDALRACLAICASLSGDTAPG